MKIETATRNDASDIVAVFRASRENGLPWLPKLYTSQQELVYFRDTVLATHTVLFTREENRHAGFIAFDDVWVHHLYLHPDFQRRSLGKALLDCAKDAACPRRLWSFQRNTGARRFYAREGFAEIRTTSGDNEEREPDVLLEWTG
jgi:GNAT superfamily N-acetyltransferase